MMRGMEEYEDCKFNTIEEVKAAVLSVLDNELEVFDPICDGPVEHAEGMAMAREIVEQVFQEIVQQREALGIEEELE